MTGACFFDAQYENANTLDMQQGLILFHGFQGKQPNLNDNQPLWVSINEKEADVYSRQGNEIGCGGVLTLTLKADHHALLGCPNGFQYLKSIDSVHHTVFAKDLHNWATKKGLRFVKENYDCFISFCASTDLNIVGVNEWSNKGGQ
ncbi:MAG: hypothetical protein ABJ375_04130 [Rhizobiaceae bacterium]